MRVPAAVLVLVLTACGSPAPGSQVVVFAAASLRTVFTDLGADFAETHPGARVELATAGSAALLTQLTQGATADVLATADTPTMDRAAHAGLLAGPDRPFASNVLTIAVAPGNPQGIRGFHDLEDVVLVVCAPQVPCGSALAQVQDDTGVRLAPASEESSVTDVLTKVTSGQADAGLVYRTDALAAGDAVSTVPFPEAAGVPNIYRIAVLKTARDTASAHRFVDLVTGPAGRRVLAAAGFGAP